MSKRDDYMKCYRCGKSVTTKDDICFVAGQPVHQKCPRKRKVSR